MEEKKNTEKLILEAAKEVFVEYGFDGASMQRIADRAGINKALLHYYFRSKDNLFEATFKEVFVTIMPPLMNTAKENIPIEDKIRLFVDKYITSLRDNPLVPIFILHELNRNPENLPKLVMESGINPLLFYNAIVEEQHKGILRPFPPRHLLINMLALSIFPFVAKPIIKGVFFDNDEGAFNNFLEERKEVVTDFILKAIKMP